MIVIYFMFIAFLGWIIKTTNSPTCLLSKYTDLVFDVLPSERPQDLCNFDMLVTLTDNLQCGGKECLVDTVKVVEVVSGVF